MKLYWLALASLLLVALPLKVEANNAQPTSEFAHHESAGELGTAGIPSFTPTDCPFNNDSQYQVECGYLSVPEDHAHPEGRQIRLAIAIARSPNPNKAPDPVLYLHGGPGGEIVSLVPFFINRGAMTAILRYRDVIMVDQRGMGHSEPAVNCDVSQSQNEIFTLSPQAITQRLTACPAQLEARGIHWQFYTTEQNAADMAEVGPALGYTTVNLLGVSYGTMLGLLILRDHPEVVRSAALDSVLPPGVSAFEQSAQWLDETFRLVEQHCQADWVCRLAYPNLRQRMLDTYQRLLAHPASIEVNGQTFLITAHYFAQHGAMAVSREEVEALPAFITAMANEDYDVAKPFIEAVQKATPSQMPNLAVFTLMACPYQAASTSPERMARAFAPYAAPFQEARFTVDDWQRCQAWGELPLASLSLPHSDIPVLLLSGAYDSSTPPTWAHYAAEGLSQAQAVEIPYTGHNVTGAGGEAEKCAVQLVDSFYADPVSRLNTDCVKAISAPAFVLHTTVTRFPILVALLPLALTALFGLGWTIYSWRKQPRWVAWRASFRQVGLMPFIALVVVVGLLLMSDRLKADDWLRTGVVTAIVPLFMALQISTVFSPDEEPAMEVTLAAPRPLAWLIVERVAALGAAYTVIALLGSVILVWQQAEPPTAQSLVVALFSWVAPALFLSGLGLYVSIRTRLMAFGAVTVLALWILFGLFADYLLPGLPVPFPLNLIQPFLWPIHVHVTPPDLAPADFWLNRLFLSSAGLTLLMLAVRSVRDSENVLLNSQRHKGKRKASPTWPPAKQPGTLTSRPVHPRAMAQIVGMARYEFLMLWRQRTMRVFVLTPIGLFLVLVAVNIFDRTVDPATLAFLPPDQAAVIYGEFLVWMTAIFVASLVLWLYPLLMANQIPSDERIGVSEWQRALPMSDNAYLAGKILSAILAGWSAITLAVAAYAIVWFMRVGPFYAIPLLNVLALCLLLLPLTVTLGVLLGATQNSTQRAMAVVLAVMVVPEFLQALPLVKQLLPGSADTLVWLMALSYHAMALRPPLQRSFEPLQGSLATLYVGLALKTIVIAALIWAWRWLKRRSISWRKRQ